MQLVCISFFTDKEYITIVCADKILCLQKWNRPIVSNYHKQIHRVLWRGDGILDHFQTSKKETVKTSWTSTSPEKINISHDCDDNASAGTLANHWLTHIGWTLTDQDHNVIVEGAHLNDYHVNFA
jgi:hypothetical protein